MKSSIRMLVVLCAAACLLLSGCIMKSVSELYAPPKQSTGAQALQAAINEVMPGGAQYASISRGTNMQPVQMVDLDGDGRDEALVFVLGSGEKPLKIYILFQQKDAYVCSFVIESGGTAFDSVEYAQLNGQGGLEIIVGRQMGKQTQKVLSVYSVTQDNFVECVSDAYVDYVVTEFGENASANLMLLSFDNKGSNGVCTLYGSDGTAMVQKSQLPLHFGADSYVKIQRGALAERVPAVLVHGIMEEKAATSVFFMKDDTLVAFTTDGDLGLDVGPVQGYRVFPMDYDSDGFIEFPYVVSLPDATGGVNSYQAILWYEYVSDAVVSLESLTYHNFAEKWYLRFPNRISEMFSVAKGDEIGGVKGLSFFANGSFDPADELFTVYTFTGSNKSIAFSDYGCFILSVRSDTVFAAKLGKGADSYSLTQEEVIAMFNDIPVNWMSEDA